MKAELCKGNEWLDLVKAQSIAAFGTFSAGSAVVCTSARKKLNRIWKEVPRNPMLYILMNM